MKPEFLCIGAHKSGTSWLYQRLKEQSEFSMPPVKEMHYFDRSCSCPSQNMLAETTLLSRFRQRGHIQEGAKAVLQSLLSRNLGLAELWMRYYFQSISDDWYLKLYDSQHGITGDITPRYSILNQEHVKRMQKIVPQARLVFLIRNPIERAWSHYRFRAKFGRSIVLNDLDAFKAFVDSPPQKLRSDYLRTIDIYLNAFDSSQLLIGFYDAIIDQPESLLSEIMRHIGAKDTTIKGSLRQVDNKSLEVDIPEAYYMYLMSKYYDDLKKLGKRFGGYASRWLSLADNKYVEQADEANRFPPVAHP